MRSAFGNPGGGAGIHLPVVPTGSYWVSRPKTSTSLTRWMDTAREKLPMRTGSMSHLVRVGVSFQDPAYASWAAAAFVTSADSGSMLLSAFLNCSGRVAIESFFSGDSPPCRWGLASYGPVSGASGHHCLWSSPDGRRPGPTRGPGRRWDSPL